MGDFSKLPDHELVALLKEGSEPAFNAIHLRYYGLLYRHAFHRFTSLRDKEEVEDLLQDLFIKLWDNRANLDPSASFRAYLYTSLRNRILNDLGKQKIREEYRQSLQHLLQQQAILTTDDMVREKELIALVEKEVAALPPRMRLAFEMSRNQHLSYEEIAEKLNISPHTARTQVRNVLRILRMKFDDLFFFTFF